MSVKSKLGRAYWVTICWVNARLRAAKQYNKLLRIWIRGILVRSDISTDATKLVVCAHPDDETIFFSSVLDEQTFVLCMSNRGNRVRNAEFDNALAYWKVPGAMLNFPDVPGAAWIWRMFSGRKLARIRKRMPNIRVVYTHSSSGESEHLHHFATYGGVRKAFNDCEIYTNAAKFSDEESGKLSETAVSDKYSVMLKCYPSQVHILEKWCTWFTTYLNREFFERDCR